LVFTRFSGLEFLYCCNLEGACLCRFTEQIIEELLEWAKKRFPGSPFIEDDEMLQPFAAEITQYLEGKRKTFTVPFHNVGTPFQLAVWHALCAIPYGQTKSYSDIANDINKPAAVRAVGAAIGANPISITVPCHRVIGKNGSLTGYRGGLEMKTLLLDLEKRALSSNESLLSTQ